MITEMCSEATLESHVDDTLFVAFRSVGLYEFEFMIPTAAASYRQEI
jgi:hypothetical protein